ncbi:MAG: TonB-dependent receptor plug domain-containing protein [Lentisphaeria bacterium]
MFSATTVMSGEETPEKNKTVSETDKLEDMVVTATKTETPLQEIGHSMSVIERQDIEATNLTKVTDILNQVRGLQFWSDGPHANSNALSIRGLQGYHSKVLINGIPQQDTSGTQVFPSLNDLTLDNVERIEVIRGASSTLYGSNAISGVVNIITRKGEDDFGGSVSSEFGSHGFQKYNLSLSGAEDWVDYAVSATYLDEDGISAIIDDDEDDAFRSKNYSADLGFQLHNNLRLEVFGRYSDTDEEYDILPDDDGDYHIERSTGGFQLAATELFNLLDSNLKLSTMKSRRGDKISGDAFKGTTDELDWRNSIHLDDRNTTTLGYTYTAEDADVETMWSALEESYYSNAFYLNHEIEALENLFLTAGLRYNDHSEFGDETTYSSSAAYLIDKTGTKLQASYSTGYRAPSLYELFDVSYGNPDLAPETSDTWDVGFEQNIFEDSVTFGVTYFETDIDDYIDYDLVNGEYIQVEGIKSDGVESFIDYQPLDKLSLRLTHTYLDTENKDTGDKLVRRPRHKLTGDVTYRFIEDRATANLQIEHFGKRDLKERVTGDDFTLANFALSYQLTDNLEVFGRVHNLLDEDYQVAHDYNTYGRTYYGGLRLSF